MKSQFKWIGLGMLLLLGQSLFAQQKVTRDTTVTFWVNGVCGMCEDRIEQTFKRKGITSADWSTTSKEVTIVYDPSQITVDQLHRWIAAAGHDTKLHKAKSAAYMSLPDCCRYREVKEHFEEVKEVIAKAKDEHKGHADDSAHTAVTPDPHLVRGVVMDLDKKGNFQPLEGATVRWLGSDRAVTTGTDGIFKLPLEEGKDKVVISYTGFRSDTLEIKDHLEVKVILANGNQLKEVEVTARQRSSFVPSTATMRTQVMTERELFKAACCNLSESFETNPSVDVAYSDAVTGSKQIQLLGLGGSYTQLSIENMPGPRGLATPMGLNYVPGPWVESIQLTKGVGSVVNGFESIAGQINVELKKPEKADKVFANVYVNDMGKVDLNLVLTQKVNAKWSTALLLHDNFLNNSKVDFNMDMFRDVPTGNLFTAMNRWHYENGKGLMWQFGAKVLMSDQTGGVVDFDPDTHKYSTHHYGFGMKTDRKEAFMKLGYVFPEKKYQSIGWQVSAFDHNQESYFGTVRYDARQKNFYSNLIYQSIIGTTAHKFRTGLSLVSDRYKETYKNNPFDRRELVPGAFFEYTYTYLDKFSVVAGVRGDHNSLYGWFASPRLHMRYEPWKGTVIRYSGGRGSRTANILAENIGSLASSRLISFLPAAKGNPFGLNQEIAWNTGLSIDQRFSLFNKNSSISVDYFYTHFQNQSVWDMETPLSIAAYDMRNGSVSHSMQVEWTMEPVKKLELRLAYRMFDVKTRFSGVWKQRPLVARHRAFANLAWEVKKWKFDYTINWIGTKRIPATVSMPAAYSRPLQSPSYILMNAQVSRSIGKTKKWDIYLGGENLTNYFQKDAIVASDAPFSPFFDASLVWGPVFGRMFYGGFRLKW